MTRSVPGTLHATVMLTLVGLPLAGCDFAELIFDSRVGEALEQASYEEMAKEEDSYVQSVLDSQNEDGETAVRAEAFFAPGAPYQLWAGEKAWFEKLATDAKQAGALDVMAIVSGDAGPKMAGSFAIVLPQEKVARAKVIEVFNAFWRERLGGNEPGPEGQKAADEEAEYVADLESYLAKDVGQKYLLLTYDD